MQAKWPQFTAEKLYKPLACAHRAGALELTTKEQHHKALAMHQQQLDLFEASRDKHGQATSYLDIGLSAWHVGSFKQASEMYLKCQTLAREIGDKYLEAKASGNLGGVYFATGQTNKAITLVEKEVAYAKEVGDSEMERIALQNLAHCFLQRRNPGDVDHAIRVLEQQLTFVRHANNKYELMLISGNLAYLYTEKYDTKCMQRSSSLTHHENEIEKAVKEFLRHRSQEMMDTSLSVAQELGFVVHEAKIWLGMGLACLGRLHGAVLDQMRDRESGNRGAFGEGVGEPGPQIPSDLDALSVKALKGVLKDHGVGTEDCCERSDLIAKLERIRLPMYEASNVPGARLSPVAYKMVKEAQKCLEKCRAMVAQHQGTQDKILELKSPGREHMVSKCWESALFAGKQRRTEETEFWHQCIDVYVSMSSSQSILLSVSVCVSTFISMFISVPAHQYFYVYTHMNTNGVGMRM